LVLLEGAMILFGNVFEAYRRRKTRIIPFTGRGIVAR
jgi:hypothetical protein